MSNVSTDTTIFKERRGKDTKSLRQLTQGVSLAFIKQLTPADHQSFSTLQLPLRLISDLPASIKMWMELFTIRNS